MGFDVRGVAFTYVAGSMFWARVDALSPLARIALRDKDFEEEEGLVDGTTAHALERCLPIAARVGGFRVAETEIVAGSVARTIADFASLAPESLPPVIDRRS